MRMREYDSRADTLTHIKRVNQLMTAFAVRLLERGMVHDNSKLLEPEKSFFDKATERLRGLTYGSPEYAEALKDLKPALDHHYAANTHHPEHWGAGIDDMDLFDVVEMLCDWKAATERHADGCINKSINYNRGRFDMSDQLCKIFENTVVFLKNEVPK